MSETGDFNFADMIGGAINWMGDNPGATGAIIGGIGALADPAQAQTTTNRARVELPEYIAPYAGRMLNRAEGLSQEEYMPYTGARLADFNADQQAAFDRYRNMSPMGPQQTQGAGIVGQAADQLLAGSNQRFDQGMADFYSSPYMQNVVDMQKREAQRDFDKMMPGIDANAQKAGAFGGARHGLVEAEARRNLSTQLGDIQTQGLQSAFTNAQGQFNADQNRMGTLATGAIGGGQTLAGIGQNVFQNQLATNQGLLGIGNQQQGLDQRSADIGYEQFQQQRQHPYQQTQYMQSFLQGLPMTQTSTATMTPAPTTTQQLISAGIGGYQLGNIYGG
jgi:hypothetical protein